MEDVLAREKAYLRENQREVAEKYPGRYLVIQGETVHGACETYDQGVNEGVALLGIDSFPVRSVHRSEDEVLDVLALWAGVPLVGNT